MSQRRTRRSIFGLRSNDRCAEIQVPPPRATQASLRTLCDGCAKCVPACPENLITITAAGRPVLNFEEAGCSFCGECTRACPTGAIPAQDDPASLKHPAFDHYMEISARCLSFRGIVCRSCGDACEERAIRFHPLPDGRDFPSLNTEDCTGCGMCIATCPTHAIDIIPHAISDEKRQTRREAVA